MPSKSKRLRRIAEIAPVYLPRVTTQPGHCILATVIGIAVCRRFGIDARPMSVEMAAFNEAMYEWFKAGSKGSWPNEAWGVGVTNDPSQALNATHHPIEKGWDGHLVIEIPRLGFMDLNSGQFSRPAKHILVPDGFFWSEELPAADSNEPGLFFQMRGEWVHEELGLTAKCAMLMYKRSTPGAVSESWTTSPDWVRGTTNLKGVINDIVSRV